MLAHGSFCFRLPVGLGFHWGIAERESLLLHWKMNNTAEFKSTAFPKQPDEDEELVNPHCWGRGLAEWIRVQLPKHGIETKDILCEDWGWVVNLKNEGFPLWIGCGVRTGLDEEKSENDDGEARTRPAPNALCEFSVFVTAEPGFFQRLFKRVDTKPATQQAVEALHRLLESSTEIQDLQWSSMPP